MKLAYEEEQELSKETSSFRSEIEKERRKNWIFAIGYSFYVRNKDHPSALKN